jgi:hypothetical protein
MTAHFYLTNLCRGSDELSRFLKYENIYKFTQETQDFGHVYINDINSERRTELLAHASYCLYVFVF